MGDGVGGDLVEHHPLHRHLRLEVFEQVPADGFPLAILVGGEIELAGILERGAQVLDHLLASHGQLVGWLEPVVDVDGKALGRQVGDVANRGAHVEVLAEKLGDGLGLGRRFDDDERAGHRPVGKSGRLSMSRRLAPFDRRAPTVPPRRGARARVSDRSSGSGEGRRRAWSRGPARPAVGQRGRRRRPWSTGHHSSPPPRSRLGGR